MRAVFLADLHVGSRWAVADPDATPRDCPGRKIQAALFDAWREAAGGEWYAPDALVLCGDAVDGQGAKSSGVDQWTTDAVQQVNHAAALLAMWGAREVYVLGGSKYHVQLGNAGVSAEEMLGQKLRAVPYPHQDHVPAGDRRRSGPQWFLTFERVTIHAAHHVAVSRVFHYKSTPIAREMMQAKLNDPMRRAWEALYRDRRGPAIQRDALHESLATYHTRLVFRGHAHYYWSCDAGGSEGINLPCWKAPDPWIQERDPLGYTHIGFVGLEFRGDAYTKHKRLWRLEDVSPAPHTVVGQSLRVRARATPGFDAARRAARPAR